MVYNIADLVAYARSRDERLANVAESRGWPQLVEVLLKLLSTL